MTVTLSRIADLPHALRDGRQFARRLDGRRPAVFLDYDGTLTPIVDRPEDAVISDSMRDAVRELAGRATVCVVSGRDRPVVAQWMGIDGLVVAGSHGFGIEDHGAGTVGLDAAIESKRFSVAVHYRLVGTPEQPFVKTVVGTLLAYADQLKVTPGKMVYEIQPKVDWDKGKAVQYLRQALHVDGGQFVSLYLGDDITDEDAFSALKKPVRPGIGVVIADPGDPEQALRTTAAGFMLEPTGEVQQFLNILAR